jgi:ABC-type multidrug transport system permease subunit
MNATFVRTICALWRKDWIVWLHNWPNVAATIVPPLTFLLVGVLGAAAVGRNPIALVTLDQGPKGIQMHDIFHESGVFRITDATPQQAQIMLNKVNVSAVITIPADFSQRIKTHRRVMIGVTINNLNLDFANDIRRSVPDVITQFYQAQGNASPIKVTVQEHDLRPRDIQLFQFEVLPTIILLLTLSGLVSSSLSTAREWETSTVKELLLSPTARSVILIGKVLFGFTITFGLGLLILVLGYVLGWIQPQGIYWLTTVLILASIALFSTGLGVALGAALQRIQPVSAITINFATGLFFLAGGIGVLAFEPTWLQDIAFFDPLTYGNHALAQAVFYSSTDLFGRDISVLGLCTLVALGLGIASMHRGIAR